MKRRDALKNLGLATGFIVATPAIVSLLHSCTSDVKTWTPVFLSEEQGKVLTKLVDIILPKTKELPSAQELNVPQFIDKYIAEVVEDEDQANIKIGFNTIIHILKPNAEASIDSISDESYKALLDKHMLLTDDIDEERTANLESLVPTKSEFLNSLKMMVISAYVTTEYIGEKVLKYDPIPSQYYCGDLQELTGGKAWSIDNSLVI
jgi:hypothetical protein